MYVTRSPIGISQPDWSGDFLDRDHLIPSFARVDLAAFGGEPPVSGTYVGRTLAEADALDPFGPAAETDDETFLIAFNANEHGHVVLTRPGVVVRYNWLPGWDDLAPALQDRIREQYHCIRGSEK